MSFQSRGAALWDPITYEGEVERDKVEGKKTNREKPETKYAEPLHQILDTEQEEPVFIQS